MAIVYEYRVNEQDPWIEAAGPTVSLTGLAPGVRYGFEIRSKDEAGNYSDPTPVFYETTPYTLGLLTFGDGDVLAGDGSDAIGTLVGNYLQPAE